MTCYFGFSGGGSCASSISFPFPLKSCSGFVSAFFWSSWYEGFLSIVGFFGNSLNWPGTGVGFFSSSSCSWSSLRSSSCLSVSEAMRCLVSFWNGHSPSSYSFTLSWKKPVLYSNSSFYIVPRYIPSLYLLSFSDTLSFLYAVSSSWLSNSFRVLTIVSTSWVYWLARSVCPFHTASFVSSHLFFAITRQGQGWYIAG